MSEVNEVNERDQRTQDVPEDDGVLQPADSLETDDLSEDPLDTGISPPERHPASERFGVTEAEQRRGESLDQRLEQERPEQPAGDPEAVEDAERSGRLAEAEDSGGRLFARDVGRDGGAASAEEAAVHLIPQNETGPDQDWS